MRCLEERQADETEPPVRLRGQPYLALATAANVRQTGKLLETAS